MTDPAGFLIRGRGPIERVMPGGAGARIYTWTSGDDDFTPIALAPGELAAVMWAGDGEDTGYTLAKPFIYTETGDDAEMHDGYLPLGSLFVGLTSMTGNGTYNVHASSGTSYIEVIIGAYGQELFA